MYWWSHAPQTLLFLNLDNEWEVVDCTRRKKHETWFMIGLLCFGIANLHFLAHVPFILVGFIKHIVHFGHLNQQLGNIKHLPTKESMGTSKLELQYGCCPNV